MFDIREQRFDHFFSVFCLDGLQRGFVFQHGDFLVEPVAVVLAQVFGNLRLHFRVVVQFVLFLLVLFGLRRFAFFLHPGEHGLRRLDHGGFVARFAGQQFFHERFELLRAVFGVDFGGEFFAVDAEVAENDVVPFLVFFVAGFFPGESDFAQFSGRVEFRTGEYAFVVLGDVQLPEGIERLARGAVEVVDQLVEYHGVAVGVLQLRHGRVEQATGDVEVDAQHVVKIFLEHFRRGRRVVALDFFAQVEDGAFFDGRNPHGGVGFQQGDLIDDGQFGEHDVADLRLLRAGVFGHDHFFAGEDVAQGEARAGAHVQHFVKAERCGAALFEVARVERVEVSAFFVQEGARERASIPRFWFDSGVLLVG